VIIKSDGQAIDTAHIISLSPINPSPTSAGVRRRGGDLRYKFFVRLKTDEHSSTRSVSVPLRFDTRFEALIMHAILSKYTMLGIGWTKAT